MWLTEYPEAALDRARNAYPAAVLPSLEAGVAVLYQKCPHLGCRVPECETSQWFECPCHGSQYNQAGERKGGPAPRGMDRFVTEVSAGVLTVDTGQVIQGPPLGTNTTGQEAEGPNCVTAGGDH
jgi:cytochrome b6-f complex iron-sulfur subunit